MDSSSQVYDVDADFVKSTATLKSYQTLDSLPFQLVSNSLHKYYNSMSTSIRRNESYRTAVVLNQENILELY